MDAAGEVNMSAAAHQAAEEEKKEEEVIQDGKTSPTDTRVVTKEQAKEIADTIKDEEFLEH